VHFSSSLISFEDNIKGESLPSRRCVYELTDRYPKLDRPDRPDLVRQAILLLLSRFSPQRLVIRPNHGGPDGRPVHRFRDRILSVQVDDRAGLPARQ